jgi:hypothetical protein
MRRNILVGRIPRWDRERLFHVLWKTTVAQVQVGGTAHTEFVICEQSIDTNHGFAKVAVENSEVAKRRTHLEQRLVRLRQWAQSAGKREAQASRRRERLRQTFTSRSKELYQDLWVYQHTLEEQGVADHMLRREIKERKAVADAELEQLRVKEWQAYEQCNAEFHKQERYCKEQREVLRALEELKAQEKPMYELDHRKDQLMTVCKVARAYLAMWVRDVRRVGAYEILAKDKGG